MKRTLLTAVGLALFCGTLAPPAIAAKRQALNVYSARVSAAQLGQMSRDGLDVINAERRGSRVAVQVVLTSRQRAELARTGVRTKLQRVKGGRTVKQFAAAQAANGFQVWRSWDEPGGIRDEMRAVARRNPRVAKLVSLGTTLQGRQILAVKVTQGARRVPDGRRPAVLYSSTQHAREWISTEVQPATDASLHLRLARPRQGDQAPAQEDGALVRPRGQSRRLPVHLRRRAAVAQEPERQQRRRPDRASATASIPTATIPNHFKYDEEGSSSIPSSETYRGPAPESEQETQALKGLLDRVGFAFQVNWHSAGQWLLYAEGWQTSTRTADDPIYFALSGNLDEPAIEGFHPGLSSDVLYVTNGETTDYAHATTGALAWTPELSEGCEGCGFVFPDDDALVQAEFERNLPFALSVAKSADDPDDPESVLGIETKPFYLKSDDPYKEGLPGANFIFDYSYGDPQPVQVLAKRSLGRVTLRYRINGGRVRSASTSEWGGGERYSPADVWYHELRGVVTGTSPGDSVEVWFTGGGKRSDSFTYEAVSESGDRVLVVAAEDYSGASPVQAPGPHYLQYSWTRWRPMGSRPTSMTSTPAGGSRPTTSVSSATTTPSSGTPATT